VRSGFTTGSCAAAASKAATYFLLGGIRKNEITIDTPKGVSYTVEVLFKNTDSTSVTCAVVKDGGDDPDVTTGYEVVACVSLIDDDKNAVLIDGGEGVGRVTRPGLDQPVGNAAINSVPRQMIQKEVFDVMQALDYEGSISVVISVPGGKELAEKTFNPRLGIEGGISILGTSGIVEPMSTRAIIETIRVELNQKKAEGMNAIVVSPGNYGNDFMKEHYDFDLNCAVKCSNYIGEAIDAVSEIGFSKMLLCGHIGKLIKVSGGIMNTHSKEADCRAELMAVAALKAGAGEKLVASILDTLNTEEAYELIKEAGIEKEFMEQVMSKIDFYLKKRAAGRIEIECIVYSSVYGLLGKTAEAEKLLNDIKLGEIS